MTTLPDDAPPVEPVLAMYHDLTLQTLLADLPQKEQSYLYDLLSTYPLRGGKGLRCALVLATCSAFGGEVDRALNSAVAVELFHNAFLIHDDIQDASEQRRGGPTLQAVFGPAIALNVGNATNLLGLQRIRANRAILGAALAWRVLDETETMLRHSLEGQAIELGWIKDNTTGLIDEDYYRMCLKKTSWYTCLYPCRVGALIASGDSQKAAALDRYRWYLGAAFQIQDDLLNLDESDDSYGKESLGDLYEGKRTLMVIHLQRTLTGPAAERLRTFLGQPRRDRTEPDVQWVRDRLVEEGSIDRARACARDLARAASQEGSAALRDLPDSPDKAFLLALPDYVVAQSH